MQLNEILDVAVGHTYFYIKTVLIGHIIYIYVQIFTRSKPMYTTRPNWGDVAFSVPFSCSVIRVAAWSLLVC